MSITELIFFHLKPEVAEQAFQTLLANTKAFDKAEGVLLRRFGRVLRSNGKDVSHEHRGVLCIGTQSLIFLELDLNERLMVAVWDNIESFRAFFPGSPVFQEFLRIAMPLASQKATPMLFESGSDRAKPEVPTEGGIIQIFTGVADHQADISSAWDRYLESLIHKRGNVEEWRGWGVGQTEGSFAGIVAWKSVEVRRLCFENISTNHVIGGQYNAGKG
ncbi:hypothetical protein SVAN01_11819 [Stagonosporopsis vannaccii]|nr:hypothetical protein SVAN01_11819 [Stagonosporopsis vannaccii]